MIDIALIKRTMKLSFKDDCMADNQFEHIEKNLKKLGYEVSYTILDDGNWFRDGDECGLKDFWAVLNIDGEKLYVELEQRCTNGPEPYYFEPEVLKILSEIDYKKSKIVPVANFKFKGEIIIIYNDNTAELKGMLFENTEDAINHLL